LNLGDVAEADICSGYYLLAHRRRKRDFRQERQAHIKDRRIGLEHGAVVTACIAAVGADDAHPFRLRQAFGSDLKHFSCRGGIATALVPPLAAASILSVRGEYQLGSGAFELAFTNMVAIQFADHWSYR